MSLQRLRTDFEFAILVMFAVVGVAGIAPFAVFRFSRGELLVGSVDLVVMLTFALAAAYIWRGGSIARAGMVVAVINTVGCILIGALAGLAGVLWTYPALLANFLLLGRRQAIIASGVIVLAVVWLGNVFDTPLQAAMYVATTLVSSVIAFVFSDRAQRQRAQLQRLADHDPLTGAYNRRAMERELPIAIEASRRQSLPVGLLMLDLDHFKRINDRFGHEAGDAVLVELAGLVAGTTRQGDRFFRYGGEEFVLLLPGADRASLLAVAEFLRAGAARQLHHLGERVTVSIGAAVWRLGEDAVQWLARADAALYRAKQEGRDRVVLDEEAGPSGERAASAATTRDWRAPRRARRDRPGR